MTSFFAIRRKVDAKGRVVLPRSVRSALRLDSNDGKATIVFIKDKRRVYIRKVEGNEVWQQQIKGEDLEKK